VGPGPVWADLENNKSLTPPRFESQTSQFTARCYTEYTIPTQTYTDNKID